MTATAPRVDIDLFDVRHLRLSETDAPPLTPSEEQARDRVWDAARQANPDLFDGPVVACAGVSLEEPGILVLRWARVTYRHYALRRVPGNTSWLPSLFVNVVQPTHDGRMLAVRMSPSTAAPGRWQLPGGSLEPPASDGIIDEAAVRGHAARELTEETGSDVAPEELSLWAATRGENRSIGVVYLAPPRSAPALLERFESLTHAEHAAGRRPELDRIALVGCPGDLDPLDGPHADYLAPVVRRFTQGSRRDGA